MLKLVDMSLQNFMRRHFFQQFNVIIGQNGISYIRTDFQESQLSQTGVIFIRVIFYSSRLIADYSVYKSGK